jgi:hypothetical protein
VLDWLLPASDRVVIAQAAAAALIYGLVLVAVWSRRDARIFVFGLAVLTFAFFGVRAVH